MDMKKHATNALKDIATSGNIYLAILKIVCRFIAGAAKEILETQQKMKENQGKATEFANELAQIDFNHANFGSEWKQKLNEQKLRNAEFSFKKEELDIRGRQLDVQLSNADIQIEQAQVGLMQAELASKQAGFAMEQAMITIEQARISLIQAEFGLESNTIAAKKADMDYAKKMLDLKKGLLDAQRTAAEAEKKFKEDVAKLYEPWLKLDDAASKYIRTIGGTKASMEKIKKDTLDYSIKNNLEGKYNISSEELIQLQMKYNQELGRNIHLTGDQMESLGAMKAMFGDEKSIKMATALDSFGYDFNRSANMATKLFKDASKHGIAVEKAASYFLDNIKMAQTFSFENGVSDFEKMAEKAAMISYDMKQVSKASKKLSTAEGIMSVSANMAILGGSFNALANPLRLLDESLNNMDALQDSMMSVTKGMAFFDSSKGEVRLGALEKEWLKHYSETLGVDYGASVEGALSQGRISQLTPQIDALGLDEDTSKLLKNVAQLDKNGNGFVNLDGVKTSLQDAAKLGPDKLAKILRAQTQNDSDNLKDIAIELRSFKDNVEAYDKSLYDKEAEIIERTGSGKKFTDHLLSQAEDSDHFKNLANTLIDVYTKTAGLNKEMSEFGAKYAEDTYGLQLESADLERRQKHFGVRAAKASLQSAELQYRMAPLQFDQAKIQMRTAKIGEETAKNQQTSAKIQRDQVDLANRKFHKVEKPSYDLQNGIGFINKLRETIYQEKSKKRVDDIYGSTRVAAESLYYTRLATASLAKLENGDLSGFLAEAIVASDAMAKGHEAQAKTSQQIAKVIQSIKDGNVDYVISGQLMAAMSVQESNLNAAMAVNGSGELKYHYENGIMDDWSDEGWDKFCKESNGHVAKVGDNIYADEIGKRMIQDVSKRTYGDYVSFSYKDEAGGGHSFGGGHIRDESYYLDDNKDYAAVENINEHSPFELEKRDDSEFSAGTNRLASGSNPVGTDKIGSDKVNRPVQNGWYDTWSKPRKYIGGTFDLNILDDSLEDNTNELIAELMSSPILISDLSRSASKLIGSEDSYGKVKTSRYLM